MDKTLDTMVSAYEDALGDIDFFINTHIEIQKQLASMQFKEIITEGNEVKPKHDIKIINFYN